MLVYIIGAEPTGFRGDGASPFADNSNPASGALGVQAVSPASGSSVARCEIEFSVRPSDLISDGNNNLFNKADVRWDVSRDKRVRKWKGTSGASGTSWVLHDDRDHWHSDDSHDSEEDNDPWDGNGHLYGVDSPSFRPPSTWIGYVKKLRMREWVRCMIGGGAARLGSRCSDYQYWHCYRSFQKSGGTWSESSDFDGNEIVSGDPGWGNTPP